MKNFVKQRKENKKVKDRLLFVIMFIFVNLCLLLFLRSSYFTIREISILGLDKVAPEEIYSALGIREGMNLWKISPPEMRDRILKIPRIAEVEIERVLPSKLVIAVEEKYPLALVSYHGYFLELAVDATVIGLRDNYTGDLPLINGLYWGRMDVGTSIPDRSRGEIIEVFLQALEENPSLPLAEINVENPQQIIVYTWEGMEVWLGNEIDLSKKIDVLHQIYQRMLLLGKDPSGGYLDLRIAETPVYKPFEK